MATTRGVATFRLEAGASTDQVQNAIAMRNDYLAFQCVQAFPPAITVRIYGDDEAHISTLLDGIKNGPCRIWGVADVNLDRESLEVLRATEDKATRIVPDTSPKDRV